MKTTIFFTAALLTLAIPVTAVQAARFSWFDDPLSDNSALSAVETRPDPNFSEKSFGFKAYDSRSVGSLSDSKLLSPDRLGVQQVGSDVIRLYGGLAATTPALSPASTPLLGEVSPFSTPVEQRLNAFGAKWQHRLDSTHSFAVSAGYRETTSLYQPTQDVLDTQAAVSWSSRWAGGVRPGLTGSLFVGDETARDVEDRFSGRKYYGFTIGGQLTLFQEHTPYLSYRLQRSLYDPAEDPLAIQQSRYSDRSQLLAGWKWQVQRNWSLQAEASYNFNTDSSSLDSYNPERSRIFFGTRFDFR